MNTLPESNSNLLFALREILPEEYLLTKIEDLKPYECDALSVYQRLPIAVALPSTIEEVQKIVHACESLRVPVVARGAGTGLSGGVLPHEGGIILSLSRFNRILEIDNEGMTMRVQPGVCNLAISEAAAPYGLYYAPDPSSQIACTIGGNVAENAGGVHCFKYGLTVHNVLEVKIITAEGDLVTLGSTTLDTPGYDLLALITGSEGMLGIIVEVVVKLLPRPPETKVLMASFDSLKDATDAVTNILSTGIIPAGLEMMDNLAIQATEKFAHTRYPIDAEAILLCELDGLVEELKEEVNLVAQIFREANSVRVVMVSSESEKTRLWAGRKAVFSAIGGLSPDNYCMDIVIPYKNIVAVLEKIHSLSNHYDLQVANVLHAGDGNLHPFILFDAAIKEELKKAKHFAMDILSLCLKMGGTITGEHGVGFEKLDQMCLQFNEDELTHLHKIKYAFDPYDLLNPDKVIPTVHQCAKLDVVCPDHKELSHSAIPRF